GDCPRDPVSCLRRLHPDVVHALQAQRGVLCAVPELAAVSGRKIDAVVMGASPTGLYALRELAGAGLAVALVDTGPGCAFHSRHVRGDGRRFRGGADAIEAWLLALEADGVRP